MNARCLTILWFGLSFTSTVLGLNVQAAAHGPETPRADPRDEDDDQPRPATKSSHAKSSEADDADDAQDLGERHATPHAGKIPGERHDDDDDEEGHVQPATTIVVTAHRLDAARTQIDAGLGATVYALTNDSIENRPGGETGSLSDILAQTPGVTLSGTRLNVRGSPANQVRINNVIIPEAVSDPADLLSSRIAETTRLITGTLPAQFGFAPAGVISITTKNGLYQHGGEAELFAGRGGMVEPALEWAGSVGATSLFASGELEHEHSELADAVGNSARDRRTGIDGLGFADHVLDQNNRVSFIVGGAHERRSIGATSIAAGAESNDDAYGVATYQHSDGGFTLQTSLFAGTGSDEARFDVRTRERRSSWGTQIDGSEALDAGHTLRFGLLATRSFAHELDLAGDRSSAARTSVALYGQDEWKLAPSWTVDAGTRIEWLRGFTSGAKLEPRVSIVWQSRGGLAGHLGFARYASAAPVGELTGGKRLPDEADDYFDGGVQQKFGPATVGIDAYWRSAHNYISEHQAIGSAIPEAFGFKRARIRGVELSGTYARHGTTAWANVSFSRATARSIIGGGELFAPPSLAAASASYIPLANDRPLIGSGGFTQRVGKFSFGGDMLVSSGVVRTLTLAGPNGGRHAAYALLGLAAVYHAKIGGKNADLRVDVTNLTNVHYVTSDAANLEGGWTRQGRRQAITIGIEQGF